MSVSMEFEAYVQDLLEPMGPIVIRRMFGGAGVYCRGAMFALIADDTLYLKAGPDSSGAFRALGCEPFCYEDGNGRVASMSYYELPPHLHDDRSELMDWAQQSLDIAIHARLNRPAPRRRRPALRR
ncbi:TfoX/Sxy family protein [Marinibaculum pumilum]|uniref:TfoX/Sxy family protein n=1 Tax=Marinibaculum pumilum TaxID=1766165 RepID=A0ABV7KWN4_9PROT